MVREFFKDSLPTALTPKKPTHAVWAPVHVAPYKTQFRSFSLDAESLGRVLSRCRAHGTTLTGLFQALSFASLAAQLGAHEALAFESGTALSMRRFLPSRPPSHPWVEPDKAIGNFVSMMSHVFGKNIVSRVRGLAHDGNPLDGELEKVIWEVAATVRGEIESKIKSGIRNDVVGLMRFVTDWRAQLRETTHKLREHSWLVTNLGVLDGTALTAAAEPHEQIQQGNKDEQADSDTSSRNWSIDWAEFIVSADVSSAAIVISPVAVKGGDLVVATSWQDCVLGAGFGDRFVANFERWTRQLAAV